MNMTKPLRLILSGIGSLVLLLLALFYPLPYYVESPGGAVDIRQVLQVNDQEDQAAGSYNFVYIHVQQASALRLLQASFDTHADIYSQEDLTGGTDSENYVRISQFYMETSQNMAKYQALTLAGKEATLEFFGVYVLNVSKDSSFQGILNIADTVTAVNGQQFDSSKDLIDYVSSLELGSDVTVTYISQGEEVLAEGQIIRLENGKNGIGIGLVDHTEVKSDIPIAFQTGNVGGPSAGLMFTLAIYTQIADPDLRGGRVIAGTGTIEKDGSVGDIGGADKKVLSAAKAGAEVFFVPNNPVNQKVLEQNPQAKTNYQEALEVVQKEKLDIELVPVTKVQDALDYLKDKKAEN